MIQKASVAAGKAPRLELGVVGISIGQKQSRGDTSRVSMKIHELIEAKKPTATTDPDRDKDPQYFKAWYELTLYDEGDSEPDEDMGGYEGDEDLVGEWVSIKDAVADMRKLKGKKEKQDWSWWSRPGIQVKNFSGAMTTYKTPEEFLAAFDGAASKTPPFKAVVQKAK